MAATVSAWGKPGAWATDAEENETELLRQRNEDDKKATNNGSNDEVNFPSLSAAAATRTKKKKPQKISLQDFNNYGSAKPAESEGLTPDELLMLPTGPRQRTAEELDRNKLGGGFKSYGGGPREERRPRGFNRESSEFMPSRADETDNWAAAKKPTSAFGGPERRERGGFFSDSSSRADDVDNWASKKSFVPSEPRRYEKRGGFGSGSGSNGSSDSDNWLRRKDDEPTRIGGGGAFDSLRERKGGFESNGGADGETWGRKREELNGGGGGGGGRPRLNLQPRTLPLTEEGDKKIEEKATKGINPFGGARPREEVLKEKGQDWKEIEEKLETIKVKESVGDVGKREGFWSGRARKNVEAAETERAWRKPMAVPDDSRSQQSASESENGQSAEVAENGQGAEVAELKDDDDVHM